MEAENDELMNGPARLALQIINGVRSVVEDLDSLRLRFGLDGANLIVLTPKVETRLRRGFRPLIPMRLLYVDKNSRTKLTLEFPISNYPKNPILVSVNAVDINCNMDSDMLLEITGRIQQYSTELASEVRSAGYGCNLVTLFNTLVDEYVINRTSDLIDSSANPDTLPDYIGYNIIESFHFTCRGCRSALFDNTMLQSHTSEVVETVIQANSANCKCASWYLQEPLPWMMVTEQSGKIQCPNKSCGAKLGSWSWSGSMCSCGEWITPAFQFVRSKLDAKSGALQDNGMALLDI